MELIFNIADIQGAASSFLEASKLPGVFAFHGEMGAGKTTFIHALCDRLQVTSRVSSPTFSIINEYSSPSGRIFHIDLYRLRDEQEALRAGVEDCLYSGETCFVEWPQRAPGIFPPQTTHFQLTVHGEGTRKLSSISSV